MIRLQQSDHGAGTRRDTALLLCRRDLIANVGTGRGTEPLATPVRSKEEPSAPDKYRPERVESLFAQHARCASVIVKDCGKRPRSFRLIQHAVECKLPGRK